MTLFDDQGRQLLRIDHGELQVAIGAWDYKLEGPNLSVYQAAGHVGVEMTFSDDGLKITRGTLYCYPASVHITPESITLRPPGFTMSGVESRNSYQTGLYYRV